MTTRRTRPTSKRGVCRLTLTDGQFVRCHLIPDAFTKAGTKGAPLIQFGSGRRPSRRWTSWHDEHLVTRTGEDILAALDDWAIRALRLHSLIWSGWGEATPLPPNHPVAKARGFSGRILGGMDLSRLRLFLLSLLWRAAATDRTEFSEVSIPEEHLEVLRQALVSGKMPDENFYPATLTQLSTRGIRQNQVPLAEMMPAPNLPGLGFQMRPIFRFYFDGLVTHFHRSASGVIDSLRPTAVGTSDALLVTLIPYERSYQRENLHYILRESIT